MAAALALARALVQAEAPSSVPDWYSGRAAQRTSTTPRAAPLPARRALASPPQRHDKRMKREHDRASQPGNTTSPSPSQSLTPRPNGTTHECAAQPPSSTARVRARTALCIRVIVFAASGLAMPRAAPLDVQRRRRARLRWELGDVQVASVRYKRAHSSRTHYRLCARAELTNCSPMHSAASLSSPTHCCHAPLDGWRTC